MQLLICAYCDVMSENLEFYKPIVVTLYHDGIHVLDQTFRGVSSYKFVFLPDWIPVEVHLYKMNGSCIYVQNEKMHAHKPLRGEDVCEICQHSLVPLACDSERFAYQDVHKWWLAPSTSQRAAFPHVFTQINGIVVYRNALREFV